jgi:hypothetical protein
MRACENAHEEPRYAGISIWALGVASLHDTRAQQLLALLQHAGDEPLSIATLKLLGIEQPGQTLYELELAGHSIERVYAHRERSGHLVGVRLRASEHKAPPQPRRRWRRRAFRAA